MRWFSFILCSLHFQAAPPFVRALVHRPRSSICTTCYDSSGGVPVPMGHRRGHHDWFRRRPAQAPSVSSLLCRAGGYILAFAEVATTSVAGPASGSPSADERSAARSRFQEACGHAVATVAIAHLSALPFLLPPFVPAAPPPPTAGLGSRSSSAASAATSAGGPRGPQRDKAASLQRRGQAPGTPTWRR